MLTRLEKKKHFKVIECVTNTSIHIRLGCAQQGVDIDIITWLEMNESMDLWASRTRLLLDLVDGSTDSLLRGGHKIVLKGFLLTENQKIYRKIFSSFTGVPFRLIQ